MSRWKKIGQGSYNTVYLSSDGRKVLKIQRKHNTKDAEYDFPERSVRLWNEVNSHILPRAYVVYNSEYGNGWVCPYVPGRKANDKEIAMELISIFNATGRVVVDATVNKNFIRSKGGKVICVDIGMAARIEGVENKYTFKYGRRKGSVVSNNSWRHLRDNYTEHFQSSKKLYPKSISVIQALLYITINRPDISNANFLKYNDSLLRKLAKAYVKGKEIDEPIFREEIENYIYDEDSDENMECLAEMELKLKSTKESLKANLLNYINSRGLINQEQKFVASFSTVFFRNVTLTNYKVIKTQLLIRRIDEINSLRDLQELIGGAQEDSMLSQANFNSGIFTCLEKCMQIIDGAETGDRLDYSTSFYRNYFSYIWPYN